jgi:hypothetical protein
MKKNLLRVTLISCLLITSLLFGGAAYAQDEELPAPGITPDSPFYFLDTWGKNISMFFTFGPEAKARKALQYAEERLSEAQAMGNKNKVREMTRAANDYDSFMAMVNERLEEAAKNGTSDNISERLAALSYRIHVILSELKDKMPPGVKKDITPTDNETREEAASASDEARATINRAKIATINSQIKALRILAKNKPERALDISSDTIEKLMERARFRVSENVTTDNMTGDVEETLDYADRIAALEEEIAAIAEEKGIDVTAIQERLAHSTANRLETLTGVYEKAPEAARNGIENAIENSVRKYERTVEKLREKNVSDEITENTTALQKIPAKIKEKLNIKISNKAQITEDISDNVTIQVRIEKENQERTKEQPAASANKTSSPQKGG